MNTVIVAQNSLEPETWQSFEVEDVCEFLTGHFGAWPDTARIYHEQVSEANDVTPYEEAGIDKLQQLVGTFYVVVYPADPTTIIIAVLAVAAAAAAAYFLMPQPQTVNNRNVQSSSPNNELSNRANRPRLLERIPDIFGSVISVPDLVSVPYRVFQNNVEVEYSYMCIGRGAYEVTEIKDDTTMAASIEGVSVEVYGPNTSPNSGDAAQVTVGPPIGTVILGAKKSSGVTGQLLKAPNYGFVKVNNAMNAVWPDTVGVTSGTNINFTEIYDIGDVVNIDGLFYGAVNLGGNFTITAVNPLFIKISPHSGWLDGSFVGNTTAYQTAQLLVTKDTWVGPFTMDGSEVSRIICNFVAPGGLFKDNGEVQIGEIVAVTVGITPLNSAGSPIASENQYTVNLVGSSLSRDTVAATLFQNLVLTGPCRVRVKRASNSDVTFDGQVVDEVKWRDMYSAYLVDKEDFGDVTTVQSVTVATAGSLAVKDRKLNMRVTRKIPQRISGTTFSSTLYPTKRVDEIISHVLLDERIGNRSLSEIDFDNIYETVSEIEAYFGTTKAIEFSHTFDESGMSLEETVASIAASIFCIAYRRGNIIKLSFEKQTEDSVLLFNHRNKLPNSESRVVRFGNLDDNDGVELQYVAAEDGVQLSLFLPADQSAINAKTIRTVGIRNRLQAYFHAWRAWNKIRYQNTAIEFEATQEADLLVIRDRILVTDNTRSGSLDGEIISQNGLELELSQNVALEADDFVIFIQHYDGTTEAIGVVQGSETNKVVLENAPKAAIAVDNELFARATFAIVGTTSRRTAPFILTEKSPNSNFVVEVSAVNYDERYYSNDFDYSNDVVDENGN